MSNILSFIQHVLYLKESFMKHLFHAFILSILSLVLTNGMSIAQEEGISDVEGSKDHPLLTRMQGYRIVEYDDKDFEAYDFAVGPEKTQRVEGHRTIIIYQMKEGTKAAGNLQILRNYSNAIKKIGGTLVYEDLGQYDVLKVTKSGNEIWVEVSIAFGWNPGDYRLTIMEKKELEQEITANDMLDALNREGHIALYINFDTGKSDIKSESQPIIDQIADMMKKNPELQTGIEGHTDNVGKVKDNQVLSEQRAKAVVAALVKQGIDAKRLTSVGLGQDKPIADNKTEEGRAKNRRVELVKK